MDAQLKDENPPEGTADGAAEDVDVEGHSVFSAVATSGALRARTPQDARPARKADENLPPLTKPFPSMREGGRK
ncbi:MAG: hypothetical protein ACHQZR_07035 [Candidatus Limnocylindrales bacterium]